MKRTTFYFIILLVFFTAPALRAQEKQKPEIVQDVQSKVVVTVLDNAVRIQNATPNSTAEIYNILGVKVFSVTIDSLDETITLNLPKGYYILKTEQIVRKLVIK